MGTTIVAPWAVGAAVITFGLGLCFLALTMLRVRLAPVALTLLLAAMLVAPSVWSTLTTLNPNSNGALPAAGPAQQSAPGGIGHSRIGADDGRVNAPSISNEGNQNQSLLDYLLANTEPGTYMLATDRASDAASYILETGRPVLAIGGFLGQYQEVSVDQLAALVNSGQLRFVLWQSLQQYQDISQWVQQNCKAVDTSSMSGANAPAFGNLDAQQQTTTLYDCGK